MDKIDKKTYIGIVKFTLMLQIELTHTIANRWFIEHRGKEI